MSIIINIPQDNDLENPLSSFTPDNFPQKYREPFLNLNSNVKYWDIVQD